MTQRDYDIIFAGGGLAATLAAYRLRQLRPELRFLVIKAGEKLGGNHTWSFHDTDIAPEALPWIKPFVARRWHQQQVRFPRYSRMLTSGYNTVFSERLHDVAIKALAGSVLFTAQVKTVGVHNVELAGGEAFTAGCVIDAMGLSGAKGLTIAYQKFLGLEVQFDEPHGQPYPIIMDATVEQADGYRFVYTLPYAAARMLIEDTYYSDTPRLDTGELRNRCIAYAKERGWTVSEVLREEQGVLPVVLGGNAEAFFSESQAGVPKIGVGGGFFHHTTSYSFPFAVQCADAIASMKTLTSQSLYAALQSWSRTHWQEQRFFRLLNRMLFWAANPSERYRILERFYTLQEPLIERFYSSSLTLSDKARVLMGRPPVPLGKALRALGEKRVNPIPKSASPMS